MVDVECQNHSLIYDFLACLHWKLIFWPPFFVSPVFLYKAETKYAKLQITSPFGSGDNRWFINDGDFPHSYPLDIQQNHDPHKELKPLKNILFYKKLNRFTFLLISLCMVFVECTSTKIYIWGQEFNILQILEFPKRINQKKMFLIIINLQ